MLWPEVLANYAEAPRDRRADPGRGGRADRGVARRSTRASPPASTSPPRCSTWPGTSSAPTTCRSRRRRRGVRGRRRWRPSGSTTRPCRPRYSTPYFAHSLARGYDAGLLLLHLERGARRRHRRVVQGERRPHPRERRPLPRATSSASAAPRTRWRRTRVARASSSDRPAAGAPRAGLTPPERTGGDHAAHPVEGQALGLDVGHAPGGAGGDVGRGVGAGRDRRDEVVRRRRVLAHRGDGGDLLGELVGTGEVDREEPVVAGGPLARAGLPGEAGDPDRDGAAAPVAGRNRTPSTT